MGIFMSEKLRSLSTFLCLLFAFNLMGVSVAVEQDDEEALEKAVEDIWRNPTNNAFFKRGPNVPAEGLQEVNLHEAPEQLKKFPYDEDVRSSESLEVSVDYVDTSSGLDISRCCMIGSRIGLGTGALLLTIGGIVYEVCERAEHCGPHGHSAQVGKDMMIAGGVFLSTFCLPAAWSCYKRCKAKPGGGTYLGR